MMTSDHNAINNHHKSGDLDGINNNNNNNRNNMTTPTPITALFTLPPAIEKYINDQYRDKPIDVVEYSPMMALFRAIWAIILFPYTLCRQYLIKEGEIGLSWYGDKPELLQAGRHILFSPTSSFVGIKRIDSAYIEHGPIKIVQVQAGQLGYAIDTSKGNPILFRPGRHVINAPTIKVEKFLDLAEEVHVIGALLLVCIRTGTVGVVYHQGHLEIIQPGFHLIEPPSKFERIISTQQQIMPLPEATYESSDYVPLKIIADVFYQITDPEHVCREIKDVDTYIRDTAVATLAGIIRNSTLADIGQSSTPVYKNSALAARVIKAKLPQAYIQEAVNQHKISISGEFPEINSNSNQHQNLGVNEEIPPPAYSFYSKVHDTFIQELQRHAIHDLGINILNIRIESMKIDNPELAQNIAAQAVRYAQVQSELANVEAQRQVQNTVARQEAEKTQIHANAEALKIEKLAAAEANAIMARASAEKEALIMQGQGKAQYALLISETPLGEQLAVLQEQAKSLSGIEKLVYLPADAQYLSSMLALGGAANFSATALQNMTSSSKEARSTLLSKKVPKHPSGGVAGAAGGNTVFTVEKMV